jgi:hypothetical protein
LNKRDRAISALRGRSAKRISHAGWLKEITDLILWAADDGFLSAH